MIRSSRLVLAACLAALTLGAAAAPVAAANPRLTLVNGIPGTTVDVCVGNVEVYSALRYGGWAMKRVVPGNKVVSFRNVSPGKCKGSVVARRTVDLVTDADLTIVGTKRSPNKVAVFDNHLGNPPTSDAQADLLYAADIGAVNVVQTLTLFATPSVAPPAIVKGERVAFWDAVPHAVRWDVFRNGRVRPFVQTSYLSFGTGQRLQAIIVGTTTANDKLVIVRRPVPAS